MQTLQNYLNNVGFQFDLLFLIGPRNQLLFYGDKVFCTILGQLLIFVIVGFEAWLRNNL